MLGLSAHSDLQNAEKQFEDTISYVKEQCTGYDNLNLATEAKSLMRVMENAQHLCSEIARDQQENPGRVLDDAAMEEYLQDYTLSGILVLSAEGKFCAVPHRMAGRLTRRSGNRWKRNWPVLSC